MKPKILLLFTFIMLLTTAFATDPWGDPVVLPGSMTVMAQVFINGMPASSNDVLAAMVEIAGTPELRGKATIQNINGFKHLINFTESTVSIHSKYGMKVHKLF